VTLGDDAPRRTELVLHVDVVVASEIDGIEGEVAAGVVAAKEVVGGGVEVEAVAPVLVGSVRDEVVVDGREKGETVVDVRGSPRPHLPSENTVRRWKSPFSS
jgi:hypothetical protein